MFSEAGIILLSRVPLARVGSKLRDEFLQELHLRIFGEGLEVFSLLLSLIIPAVGVVAPYLIRHECDELEMPFEGVMIHEDINS